jgi:hypothetical protein
VAEFKMWDVYQVLNALKNEEFKPNSALVMIDFMIRRGIINPANEMAYAEIAVRLRRGLPTPIGPA